MKITQLLRQTRSGVLMAGVLCALFPLTLPQVIGQGRSYVDFEPLDTVTVKPGKTTPVQFTFHVKNGYHVNSNKPLTEELIPTSLGFSPPPDIILAKVQYPAGQITSFPFDPNEKLSVYSGDVIVKAVIITQPQAPAGTFTVHGEFKYQACDNNSCYPPKKLPVQFDVKVVPASATGGAHPTAQSPHIHN